MQEYVPNSLYFGNPGQTKILRNGNAICWPGILEHEEDKAKKFTTCENICKDIKLSTKTEEK